MKNLIFDQFEMNFFVFALSLFSLWQYRVAVMLPTPTECHESFIDIYPPKLMETWFVIKHTDSLLGPSAFADCMIMKFGRRMSFNSQIRMDIIYANGADTSDSKDSQPLRGEVTVPGKEPFGIHIPSSSLFPVNLMVTHLDESNDCLAFWSCADLGPSLSQKGAWIVCKSTGVSKDVVEDLVQKVSNASNIEPSNFVWTNYEKCI